MLYRLEMIYQNNNFTCGSAAIVNALQCYGRNVSFTRTSKLFSDPQNGTNEFGIAQGLAYWGHPSLAINETKVKVGWLSIYNAVLKGNPSILCVDSNQHWIAVVGVCGEKIVTFDSSNTIKNSSVGGIHLYTRRSLSKRWKSKENKMYGFIVLPQTKNLTSRREEV